MVDGDRLALPVRDAALTIVEEGDAHQRLKKKRVLHQFPLRQALLLPVNTSVAASGTPASARYCAPGTCRGNRVVFVSVSRGSCTMPLQQQFQQSVTDKPSIPSQERRKSIFDKALPEVEAVVQDAEDDQQCCTTPTHHGPQQQELVCPSAPTKPSSKRRRSSEQYRDYFVPTDQADLPDGFKSLFSMLPARPN